MADIGDMIRMLERVKKARNSSVPPKIATLMLQETRENFRKEGYTQDGGIKKWPQRSHEYMLNYPILTIRAASKEALHAISRPNSPESEQTPTTRRYSKREDARITDSGAAARPTLPSHSPAASAKSFPAPSWASVKKLTRVCVRYLPKKSEKLSTDSIFL